MGSRASGGVTGVTPPGLGSCWCWHKSYCRLAIGFGNLCVPRKGSNPPGAARMGAVPAGAAQMLPSPRGAVPGSR